VNVTPPPLQFDMSPLRVGTMLRTPPGSRTQIPHLPDMTTDGYAWVVESTPTVLRIRERATVWGRVPATFDQVFRLTAPGIVDFSVRATGFGVPMPTMRKRYELLDAGRGWLQLRSADRPGERPGSFRVDGSNLLVDLPGPLGSHDRTVEPIVQPGEAGYVQPPAGWLPAPARVS
jgi:hypothetical protein